MNTIVLPDLTVTSTDTVVLRVKYADNLVLISSNQTMVYSKRTEHTPRLNDKVELTRSLRKGLNFVNISCVDWGGRARFHIELEVNGNKVPDYVIDIDRAGMFGLASHNGLVIKRID